MPNRLELSCPSAACLLPAEPESRPCPDGTGRDRALIPAVCLGPTCDPWVLPRMFKNPIPLSLKSGVRSTFPSGRICKESSRFLGRSVLTVQTSLIPAQGGVPTRRPRSLGTGRPELGLDASLAAVPITLARDKDGRGELANYEPGRSRVEGPAAGRGQMEPQAWACALRPHGLGPEATASGPGRAPGRCLLGLVRMVWPTCGPS